MKIGGRSLGSRSDSEPNDLPPAFPPSRLPVASSSLAGALACLLASLAGCSQDGAGAASEAGVRAEERGFRRLTLSAEFQCEGANFGDFDRDGDADVVAGPFWYAGPDFTTRHAIYPAPAEPFDVKSYSNNFFAFVHDFSRDGFADVLAIGFPGQDATWYENPTRIGALWVAHRVFDGVDNEAPAFTDLTGDGKPELVFMNQGRLGWAEPDWENPTARWTFHPLSPPDGRFGAFTHGLGVGDVDGDGRSDVLESTGFWLQPGALAGDPLWEHRPQPFAAPGLGGAQMWTDDIDADGDADVVTSVHAHGFGISWFEQVGLGSASFVEHVIVPAEPGSSDVIIHEPHALALHDLDGDGDRDLVSGERFWGHVPPGEPSFDDPARVYWFELVRGNDGPQYVPHLADAASGVGTQVVIGDVTGDGQPDVVTANKKGTFVLAQAIGP